MTPKIQFYTEEDWNRLEADPALDCSPYSVTAEHDGDDWIVNVCDWLEPSERPARDAEIESDGWRLFGASADLIAYMSSKGYPRFVDSASDV